MGETAEEYCSVPGCYKVTSVFEKVETEGFPRQTDISTNAQNSAAPVMLWL